jgi:cytochrome b561
MKKYINIAFVYAMFSIACGVFYREFTKFYGFTGKTTLSVTHLHFFVLGTVMFLIIGLYSQRMDLQSQKRFKAFMILYNIGLPLMVVMFFVRGIAQVMGTELSTAYSSAISGVAGISHTILTVALILLFLSLKKSLSIKEKDV